MINFNIARYDFINTKLTNINSIYMNKYIVLITFKKFSYTISYQNKKYKIILLNKSAKNILNFESKKSGMDFLKDFFIQNIWRDFDRIQGCGYFYED